MIDYVKRNDIFGDFRRNLSNSEIARKRGISRTTVVGLRKLFNATVNDKDNAPKEEGKNAVEFAGCDLGRGFVGFGTQLDRKRYPVAGISIR